MVTIIAGSRGDMREVGVDSNGFIDWRRHIGKVLASVELIQQAVELSGFHVTEVVSGLASGVDLLGKQWGEARNIPIKYMPANWKTNGKCAGMLRNRQMAMYAKAFNGGLIAIHDGKSTGTAGMIAIARELQLMVYVMTV